MTLFDESRVVRDASGRFDEKEHTLPDVVLGFNDQTGTHAPADPVQEAASRVILFDADERILRHVHDLRDQHPQGLTLDVVRREIFPALGGTRRARLALSRMQDQGVIEYAADTGLYRSTAVADEYLHQRDDAALARRQRITTINPEG